ncbi:MAG: amidohydrolase family protein [Bryobacteraceae bacterium]|nr:amidohydrolase family protein [Bryobacteraceae bacterium]
MSYIERREVLSAGLVSLASFIIGGPLTPKVAAESRRSIFDAHLHIPSDNGENFQWNLVTPTMPEFVAYLDKCGVKRGVISSSWSNKAKSPEDYRNGNNEVAKYSERYKGRFRGSCVITPHRIDDALSEIERCRKELGFVWLGECCNYMTGYKYDTPEWTQVMKLATELNMVLQIHTTTAEMRYLAENFPNATIVFPHLGSNLKDISERIEIVARHKNTHLELSGSGHERVGIVEKAVNEIGADRVLYGSDFTINEPSGVIMRVKNAFLTKEERDKILFGNLERLLAKAAAG